MTNKKFKLAAMSLATAVTVSTVGPSASAVTYQLENGDVTVAENEKGAFSYQNTANGQYCHCGRKCHEQEWRP